VNESRRGPPMRTAAGTETKRSRGRSESESTHTSTSPRLGDRESIKYCGCMEGEGSHGCQVEIGDDREVCEDCTDASGAVAKFGEPCKGTCECNECWTSETWLRERARRLNPWWEQHVMGGDSLERDVDGWRMQTEHRVGPHGTRLNTPVGSPRSGKRNLMRAWDLLRSTDTATAA